MDNAYIGLGGNQDDPPRQLRRAVDALRALPQTRVRACSGLYRSPPLRHPDIVHIPQADYVNAVVALETGLAALDLLDALQAIEQAQGRTRNGLRWGPRPLDLDILLYGALTLRHPRLHLPHPGLRERAFVLYPLAECAPDLRLPDGTRLPDLLAACPAENLERIEDL
jgi:2-amino-4-hydroxy-6-hydroxymethyldihydropteridine diphosphokinase